MTSTGTLLSQQKSLDICVSLLIVSVKDTAVFYPILT